MADPKDTKATGEQAAKTEKKKCARCKTGYAASAKQCPNCGAPAHWEN